MDSGAAWTGVLPGTRAFSIAPALSSGSVVYAYTASGIVRSFDRGDSWAAAGPGVPSGPDVSVLLAVDPADPLEVYAASRDGFFRSDDGAATWRKTPFQIFAFSTGGVGAAVTDPRRPGTLYVVDLFCGLGCLTFLRRTDDRGETGAVTLGTSRIPAISVDDASIVFAATLSNLLRSRDRGTTFEPVGSEIPFPASSVFPVPVLASSPTTPLTIAGTAEGQLFATEDHGATWHRLSDPAGAACDSAEALCLGGGRFRVTVDFVAPGAPQARAHPIPMTSDTGAFWFFSENNVELVAKVVDGRAFNGHYWVFAAGLSDVTYTVTVTDGTTGVSRVYANTAGELASRADTSAF